MAFGRRASNVSVASVSHDAQFSDITTVRRHRPDYMIVLLTGLLMMLGLIVMYAIGPQRANVLNNAYGSDYSSTYFFVKQLVSLVFAIGAFIFAAFVPYVIITKQSSKILFFAVATCAFLAISGWLGLSIAQNSLGATRWFNLGVLGSFQPAEMLKFAVLLFGAGFIGARVAQGKINDRKQTLIPIAIIIGIAMLIVVVIQKDLGTGLSIIGITLSMLFIGGLSKRNFLSVIIAALAIGLIFVFSAPHRIERIVTFMKGDNSSVDEDSSYQVEHAKIAMGAGGLFGVGIGNSVQATGYLPEAINDSVFAIMGETFGFVGLMVILAVFTALLMRLLVLMDHMVDIRLKLLIAGVFGWFGSHVILNVASMTGVFPLTGITLPLLSFGGTSMMFIAAALGLVFQLSSYTVHTSRLKEVSNENPSGRRGFGRSRYAGRSSYTRN